MLVTYRLRNTTKNIYEYVEQDSELAAPLVGGDNPSDVFDTSQTTIVKKGVEALICINLKSENKEWELTIDDNGLITTSEIT